MKSLTSNTAIKIIFIIAGIVIIAVAAYVHLHPIDQTSL
jgi:uncharacterized membrane protein